MSVDARPETDVADRHEDAQVAQASPMKAKRRVSTEQLALLVTIPLLVIVVGGGWVIWRQNATLDDIEARPLDWNNIFTLTGQHLKLALVAAVFVLLIAVPLGIMLTRDRFRHLAGPVVAIANSGQAAPVIGLIVLLAIWLGFGFWTAILGLTLYGILPVLQNTVVGLRGIDRSLIEAGRGMGMSTAAVLFRVELPLAVPVIMAGVRTALVLMTGAAALATFINAGGLGSLITTGIALFRYPVLVSGAVLIALLALLIDWLGRVLELVVRPKGL